MRVLFISLEFVLPASSGLRVRTLSQLRLLAAVERVESITFVSLRDSETQSDRLRELETRLPKVRVLAPVFQPIHMRRHPRSLPRLLRLRAQGLPYLVAKCDSAEMHGLLRQELERGAYDVVYIGYLGMCAYLKDIRKLAPNARVVLEEHNVEWEIFDRLADSFKPMMRRAAKWEAQAMKRFERTTLRKVDAVIAISDRDGANLKALSGKDAVTVPPFTEVRTVRVETTNAPALLYIGQLAWQPNVHGLDWFCREVWPRLKVRVPDATLTIAGPGLRPAADGSLAVPAEWQKDGITTVGFVDDLDDVYKTTSVMVAPVLGGSGVRMKLLEAMAAGMPTVTTTDGAAGLDVVDGREVMIADAPEDFAEKTQVLLEDAARREGLRSAGYAYLTAHHAEDLARRRLELALGL